MSVIIRLQNLPLSANANDIRHFFFGLKIPEGSVHIVGGPEGDAFIGFATDEDARQAMRIDGCTLHESNIKLLLSSRVEMDTVIARARTGDLGKSAAITSSFPSHNTDGTARITGFGSFPVNQSSNELYEGSPQRSVRTSPSVHQQQDWMRQSGRDESWVQRDHSPHNAKIESSQQQHRHSNITLVATDHTERQQKNDNLTLAYHIKKKTSSDGGFYDKHEKDDPTADAHLLSSSFADVRVPPCTPVTAPTRRTRPSLLPAPLMEHQMVPPADPCPRQYQPPFDPSVTQMNGTHCVEISRLPTELLRPAALEQWLHPSVALSLSSVKVVYDPQGFPLHSLVQFHKIDDTQGTLARDGEQGIRIRPCSDLDFERAVDGSNIPQQLPLFPPDLQAAKGRFCLELCNVPFRADDRDIASYLGPTLIVPNRITRLTSLDGRPSDRWALEFNNLQDAQLAFNFKGEIRGRTIYCRRISNEELDKLLAVSSSDSSSDSRQGQRRTEELKMDRNSHDRQRQQSREKSAEYRHRRDARSRSPRESKDRFLKRHTNKSVVESTNQFQNKPLLPPRQQQQQQPRQAAARREFFPLAPVSPTPASSHQPHQHLQRHPSVMLSNVPPQSTNRDIDIFLGMTTCGLRRLSPDTIVVSLSSAQECVRALQKNGSLLDSRRVSVSLQSPSLDRTVVADLAKMGAVVAVCGLPANVTLDDLVGFMGQFRLQEDSVRMHFDGQGHVTGDCLLALASVQEASQAVAMLDGQLLNGSVVSLFQVTQ